MAARPDTSLHNATIVHKVVAAGQSVTAGRPVKLITDDDTCQHSGVGEAAFGIALQDAAAGVRVQIALCGGGGIVPVLVGTGGATRDLAAVVVANGVTNSATLGGGTVLRNIVGYFTQSGVAGDLVGLVPLRSAAVSV